MHEQCAILKITAPYDSIIQFKCRFKLVRRSLEASTLTRADLQSSRPSPATPVFLDVFRTLNPSMYIPDDNPPRTGTDRVRR